MQSVPPSPPAAGHNRRSEVLSRPSGGHYAPPKRDSARTTGAERRSTLVSYDGSDDDSIRAGKDLFFDADPLLSQLAGGNTGQPLAAPRRAASHRYDTSAQLGAGDAGQAGASRPTEPSHWRGNEVESVWSPSPVAPRGAAPAATRQPQQPQPQQQQQRTFQPTEPLDASADLRIAALSSSSEPLIELSATSLCEHGRSALVGGTTLVEVQRQLLLLERDLVHKAEVVQAQRNALGAYASFVLDAHVGALHELFLFQHRSLVSAAARLLRDVANDEAAVIEAVEGTALVTRTNGERLRRSRRRTLLEEEMRGAIEASTRDAAAERDACRGRAEAAEAELGECQRMLRAAQAQVRELQQQTQRLDRQCAEYAEELRLPTDASPTCATSAAGPKKLRSPLHRGRSRSPAAAGRGARWMPPKASADAHAAAPQVDGVDGPPSSPLLWRIEALAVKRDHARVTESWLAAESLQQTMRARVLSQAAEITALRAELLRAQSAPAPAMEGRLPAEPNAQGPRSAREASTGTVSVGTAPFASPPASRRGSAAATDSGGSTTALLEAIVAGTEESGDASPLGAEKSSLTAHTDATDTGGHDPASWMVTAGIPPLTCADGYDWRGFERELVARADARESEALDRLARAAESIAQTICATGALPSAAEPLTAVAAGATSGGLAELQQSRQCLQWSSAFYAQVAAYAHRTLRQFHDKLAVLDRADWQGRMARKVLGRDHAAMLQSLVACLDELVVPTARTDKDTDGGFGGRARPRTSRAAAEAADVPPAFRF